MLRKVSGMRLRNLKGEQAERMRAMECLLLFLPLLVPLCAEMSGRPPAITKQPDSDIFFKSGERVYLPCIAEGFPTPVFSWERNGRPFEVDLHRILLRDGGGSIFFVFVQNRDEGVYQCFAENRYGKSLSIKVNLLAAVLKEFPTQSVTRHSPRLGDSLRLRCFAPVCVPAPLTSWAVLTHTGALDPVTIDKRVSREPYYHLRFANVKSSDTIEGQAYVCVAYNPVLNRTAIGPQHVIYPQGEPETLEPPTFTRTPFTYETGLRGENFSLKCISAGNPAPDIHWERTDGKALPERATQRDFGRELLIEDLQFDDAGAYRCLATNNVTAVPVHSDTNVLVESRPNWVVEPSDLDLAVQETANITCLADGVPKPWIVWYINGVPLKEVTDPRLRDGRFEQQSPFNIVFSRLTSEDSLVIQCNATNRHGHIWADFFLRVSADNLIG